MPLTLKEAQKMMQAAEACANQLGIKVSISIVDGRGDLVAAARMDGARFFTTDVARGKAMASAIFGQPSAAFAERASMPVFQSLNLMHQGKFVFFQGALPIARSGETLGAIGVSGGTAQQDEDVAKAGLSAL